MTHMVIKGLIAFFGFGFLGLGGVFLIAGGSTANYGVAAVMIAIGIVMLFFVFRAEKEEVEAIAKQPHFHEHKYDIKMEGSGNFTDEPLVCPYCGAPAQKEDVSVVAGGLMIKCQYCEKVSQLEEAP